MANKFLIEISAVDKATAIVRKINKSLAAITEPITRTQRSVKMLGRELGFDKVGKSLSNVGKSAGDVAAKVGRIAAPLAAVAGVGSIAGVATLAAEWGKLGSEITRTSTMLGISTTKLQSWQSAGRAFGVSAQETTGSIAALGNTIEDALYGRNQTALMMMNRLGLSVHRMKDGTIDTTRSMMDLSRVLSKIPNAQVRGLVARTFGVESMLPVLVQGPKALAAYQERVTQLGGVMSETATGAANRFGLSLNLLGVSLHGLRNTIASKLIPVLQPFVDRLTDWIGKNRELIASKLDNFLAAVSVWLKKIDFNKVLDSITRFLDKVNSTVDAIGGWKNAIIGLAIVMNGSLIASVVNLGSSLGSLTLTTIPAALRGLGLLSSAFGASAGAGAGLLSTLGLAGAALAGSYAITRGISSLADWADDKQTQIHGGHSSETLMGAITGVRQQTLGGEIYDLTHPNGVHRERSMAPGRNSVHVVIEHKNAPPGTQTKITTKGAVTASARIAHSMPSTVSP